MENWKVIHGTDGALDVSDAGRVRSNLRNGRILKQQKDSKHISDVLKGKRDHVAGHRFYREVM